MTIRQKRDPATEQDGGQPAYVRLLGVACALAVGMVGGLLITLIIIAFVWA